MSALCCGSLAPSPALWTWRGHWGGPWTLSRRPSRAMPVIPARKGFGPGKAGWSGWRDKVGMTIRPGPNVFVIVAHAAWGGVPAGRIPARLFRSFHYPGDRLGKYRLDAEYTWCLDHAMLMALGPHVSPPPLPRYCRAHSTWP